MVLQSGYRRKRRFTLGAWQQGRSLLGGLLGVLLLGTQGPSLAAAAQPPLPVRDPLPAPQNVFYGAVPPGGDMAPVMVFIHGFRGIAADWWTNSEPTQTNNDMYELAYEAGFRTAFISLSADPDRRDTEETDRTTEQGAANLVQVLPQIAERLQSSAMYVVAHSQGNLDLQRAMLDPNVSRLIRAVFAIACPCHGSELADWADKTELAKDIAKELGIYGPALLSLKTDTVAQLRADVDPVLSSLGITFYTLPGDRSSGNILTAATGLILADQIRQRKQEAGEEFGNLANDGFVSVDSGQLPTAYSVSLGTVHANHFDNKRGNVIFSKINAEIKGIELTAVGFRKVANDGFRSFYHPLDPGRDNAQYNTWAWAMKWFKGKLYVGTGRMILCMTLLTSDVVGNSKGTYNLGVLSRECPPQPVVHRFMQAEIWRYTPEARQWELVFRSPNVMPVFNRDENGEVVEDFTARDVGFRGMVVVTEKDGTEALYVGSVTSGSVFDVIPPYDTGGWAPPRILRTVDGVNWTQIPADPGTFLGDLGKNYPGSERRMRSLRGMTQINGKLFATLGDFRGVGTLIVSENPELGNNAWQPATNTLPETFPVWNIEAFNGFLYIMTGDKALEDNPGWQIFKIDPSGPPPYELIPVITNGGCAPPRYRPGNGLSFGVFKNKLYFGTDRPTQIFRINPDDTWDIVTGQPREVGPDCNTAPGFKRPISGLGDGFGNIFTGHFWRMGATAEALYVTTWNWSISFRHIPLLDSFFRPFYGFDLYRTTDGIHWTAVTRSGFNDHNYGGRSMEPTPFGLFIGSATPSGGLQIYQEIRGGDSDGDGVISSDDVNDLLSSLDAPSSGPNDPRDFDGDGQITILDARKLATQCSTPGCARPFTFSAQENEGHPVALLPAPQDLNAASFLVSPNTAKLTWQAVPGAARYRVYRMTNQGLLAVLPEDLTITIPGIRTPFKIPEDAIDGRLDFLCNPPPILDPENPSLADLDLREWGCVLVGLLKGANRNSLENDISFPSAPEVIAETTATSFEEPAPTVFQSLYFVRALDAAGRPSGPSNLVGAPSKGPVTVPQ